MALKKEFEDAYKLFVIFSVCVLLVNLYYFAHPFFAKIGLCHEIADAMLEPLVSAGFLSNPYKTKVVAVLLSSITMVVKHGKGRNIQLWQVLVPLLVGILLYFFPWKSPTIYLFTTIIGFVCLVMGVAFAAFYLSKREVAPYDMEETFQQCEELIETEYSINLPMKFKYNGAIHNGYINIINPFAGTLITGVPGTGKSFSIFLPACEQMIKKGFTMFLYDFKYPTLTYDIYNMLRQNQDCYRKLGRKVPSFHVVNFTDPRYSHRCNPLNRIYLKDLNACTEIADVLMETLAETGKKDYFFQSGKLYINCCMSFLWLYKNGKYCTFPHLIELMSQPAEKVTQILSAYKKLRTKVATFKEELAKNAQETIAGQVSSATVPLAGMATPELYWALSADDFTLDISNPEAPKIVCVGNDPDNKAAYSAGLSLFCARIFKILNHPGNLPSAIVLDESPSLKPKDIDTVVSTARSNKVATIIGGQDESQFNRDYGKDNAQPIFNTVANIISGRVNRDTAENYSKMFGKQFREKRSHTLSDDNESISISFNQESILPRSTIETLSTGTFFGKTADEFDAKNKYKLFCGEVQVDMEALKERKRKSVDLPQLTSFDEDLIREAFSEKGISDDMLAELELDPNPRETALLEMYDKMIGTKITGQPKTREEKLKILENVDEKNKNEFLESYINEIIEQHIHRKLELNMLQIQRDIDDILHEHNLLTSDEEMAKKAQEAENVAKDQKNGIVQAIKEALTDKDVIRTLLEESDLPEVLEQMPARMGRTNTRGGRKPKRKTDKPNINGSDAAGDFDTGAEEFTN